MVLFTYVTIVFCFPQFADISCVLNIDVGIFFLKKVMNVVNLCLVIKLCKCFASMIWFLYEYYITSNTKLNVSCHYRLTNFTDTCISFDF